MALADLTGQNIKDTYQRLLQVSSSGDIVDGTGSLYVPPTASHALTAVSASHEITYELSSSYAETSSYAVNFEAFSIDANRVTANTVTATNGYFSFLSGNSPLTLIPDELIVNASQSFQVLTGTTSSIFISQSNGHIGFNTNDPQSQFDAVVNEAQFQRPGSRKGLKINDEGNIESFNKDSASANTGSEFVLNYSRGALISKASLESVSLGPFANDTAAQTFFNNLAPRDRNAILTKIERVGFIDPPRTGDTLGSIRWVAESGSVNSFNKRTSGETAVIKAVVSDGDASGIQADMIFSVAGKTGGAQQVMILDAAGNHEITGSLSTTGNISSNNFILGNNLILSNNSKIMNTNENGTYIQSVDDDYWRVNANNRHVVNFSSTNIIMNPGNESGLDFTVKSDNYNAIVVDSSDDSLSFNVPVTASGDISSSGELIGLVDGGNF